MDAVLFDFGGTLDSDGLTWIDRFYALYKEEGVEVAPRSRFDRAFYDADDGLALRFPLEGCSLERTVRLQVRCVLEAVAPQNISAAPRITARFLEDCRAHFRRNAALLERLAGRYRLGVVSNFYGNLEAVLESEGLRRHLSAVVDSAVVGHMKPSAEIFRAALSALGCRAEDCLMVGDSIARDMRGAEALGMRHALLTLGETTCCAQAWRIKSLDELEGLLCPV